MLKSIRIIIDFVLLGCHNHLIERIYLSVTIVNNLATSKVNVLHFQYDDHCSFSFNPYFLCLFQQTSNTNSTGNTSNTSSTPGDNTQTGTSGPIRPSVPHSSHIVTRHAPYQMSYHPRGNRSHRGAGHPRGEPLPKKTTGIPRDRLITISKHIPGALRDQTGASVVPRQMV